MINPKLAVFQSWPDFADSPRALYEHVVERGDLDTFWVVRNEEVLRRMEERGIACALEGSDEANEKIAEAQFLISAAYELAFEKRPGQIFISTWHGFALKLTGFFDSAVNDPAVFPTIRFLSTQFDAVTMTSQAARLLFSGMYAIDPRKVFATGFPRNDYLFSEDGKAHLAGLLGEEMSSGRLVLYMPTMRKSLKEEGAQFADNLFNYGDYDPDAIDRVLEDRDAYLVAKLHPSDEGLLSLSSARLPKRMAIIDSEKMAGGLLTIYHVLNAFDCLVTDYSSIYVDYLLLDRPVIFSCPDLSQYGRDRGYCVDDPTLLMPGAIVENQAEFVDNLERILGGTDEYAAERARMMPFFHTHVDGEASRRVYELMLQTRANGSTDIAKETAALHLDPAQPMHRFVARETLELEGEVFLDDGTGFSETSKRIVGYSAGNGRVSIAIDVPEGTRCVRFDPCETGRLIMRDLLVFSGDEPLCYEVPGGTQIDDVIIFPAVDPQVIVPVEGRGVGKLVLDFDVTDMLSQLQGAESGPELLIRMLRQKDEELSALKNTRSSRLLKRLKGSS